MFALGHASFLIRRFAEENPVVNMLLGSAQARVRLRRIHRFGTNLTNSKFIPPGNMARSLC